MTPACPSQLTADLSRSAEGLATSDLLSLLLLASAAKADRAQLLAQLGHCIQVPSIATSSTVSSLRATMKVLLSLLLLVASTSASSLPVLTASNLRSEIQAHPISLVMYEAPWSPQSIEGKPVLEQLAAQKSNIFVATLDCETKETNGEFFFLF